LFPRFCKTIVPLLERNIQLQLDHGAEVVMIFDTAAGELAPSIFTAEIAPQLQRLTATSGSRTGYYSKGTQTAHLRHELFDKGKLAGIGVDHRWDLGEVFSIRSQGFVQGNFDQTLLFAERSELLRHLKDYLQPMTRQHPAGWICGLGHGVLPGTPEDNVRLFVDTVREVMQ
jgi:uroporphyrinogen decarboxylase